MSVALILSTPLGCIVAVWVVMAIIAYGASRS
jgi:hypothetical protein